MYRPVAGLDPTAPDGTALLVAEERGEIEALLLSPDSDPALVTAVRHRLDGAADPLGAAALAHAVSRARPEVSFADGWALRHGLVFAARAAVELFELAETDQYLPGLPRRRALARRGSTGLLPGHLAPHTAGRVRELLAVADQETHRQTVAALAACRTSARRRLVTTYLAAGTPGWAGESIADQPESGDSYPPLRSLLYRSLDDPAQAGHLAATERYCWLVKDPAVLATLADAVGPDCLPMLARAIEQSVRPEELRELTAAVVELPTDAAFALLLGRLDDMYTRPALQAATDRYPGRATRLLADLARTESRHAVTARHLLAAHLTRCPVGVAQLDPEAAEFVRAERASATRAPEASAEDLPALLVSPPWAADAAVPPVRVLTGLGLDAAPQLCWLPGEHEQWSRPIPYFDHTYHPTAPNWAAEAEQLLGGTADFATVYRLLLAGPAEELTAAVAAWRPLQFWRAEVAMPPIIAKYGLAALPAALTAAMAKPTDHAALLLPFLDTATARFLAAGLAKPKSVAPVARSWFARHGLPAALRLVPDAVGPTGAARTAATRALRLIATAEGTEAVLAATAERFGAQAAEILAETLPVDPLRTGLPARLPELPGWLPPAVLPQLLLSSGAALPEAAVRHVLTMLALSGSGEPYPGLAAVKAACRADSLAAFGWAVFEAWRQATMPAKESWALYGLGFFGDEETVRRLSPLLREWPGQSAHHRAVEGLTVLAGIGGDTALRQLQAIAQRVKFKALKERAQEKIAEVAAGLGLTAEQLADRLVPDLGLAPDATTVVDYGPRRFTVGFDHLLRPYVRDAAGKQRKDLPTPAAGDDQELATAERKHFLALKKEARALAADQTRRLEAAMLTRRTVTASEFAEHFVAHPLTGRLVRRLLWCSAGTAFRVAEDGRYLDLHGRALTLPEDATVLLPHPLQLGPALAAWTALFTAQGLSQPFPQLARPTHAFTLEEAAGHRLHRFEGHTVPVGRLLALLKRGWQRGEQDGNGMEGWISKPLPDGRHLLIHLDEGLYLGDATAFPDQTLEQVWLDTTRRDHWAHDPHPATFAQLDPLTASELLADLTELTSESALPS
ncbi:DUF4132 domain-containing protein [Kitasatospora sp. MMS16-BH015]|uniref:DUF4132 domain-containing protein n=1 Tax=Kitasatospora sp. MMS16-BH015 TaxID=2018025 RepID=UPI00131A5A79|nr:DUF4132 domain-containing protein [Kitasatospora sp. MMS16-BH015]